MSANFYLSSHANNHLHPRAALLAARVDDLRHATDQELAWVEIWSAGAMQKICKRLSLRQQVLATAVTFFRRFYLRNSYCETAVCLVAAACCYVAAKAEETPVHVKSAVGEARAVFTDMGHPSFPLDNHRLAEMEFYLLEELDFHLVVYHPYRALVQLTGREGGRKPDAAVEEGRRMLEMDDTALQMAWFIINDTYRSSLLLIHPPHLIALAAIYLAFALHPPASCAASILPPPPSPPATASPSKASIAGRTRRASQDAAAGGEQNATPAGGAAGPVPPAAVGALKPSAKRKESEDPSNPIAFLASLQVDTSLVLEIVQEIISLYELWSSLESAPSASPAAGALRGAGMVSGQPVQGKQGPDERVLAVVRRMQESRGREIREERARVVQQQQAKQGRGTG
ncbi:hypothetical protein JCM10213_003774 [Rhodosporidiobolus nylandii]